eukprot:1258018-Alexandrium_andersonii.AAC.1
MQHRAPLVLMPAPGLNALLDALLQHDDAVPVPLQQVLHAVAALAGVPRHQDDAAARLAPRL